MNISFDKQNMPITSALILAVVILLASLVFALIPKPNVLAQIQTLKKNAADAEYKGKKLRTTAEEENKISVSQSWAGTGDEIGPIAYAAINKLATDRKVKVVSFRPNRPINAGDVTQIPFVINVTGEYPNVVSFVKAIETTPTKLAVELLQLGAVDDSSDNVTGTVGVEAYVLNAVVSPTSTKTVASTPVAPGSKTPKGPPTTVISATETKPKDTKNAR